MATDNKPATLTVKQLQQKLSDMIAMGQGDLPIYSYDDSVDEHFPVMSVRSVTIGNHNIGRYHGAIIGADACVIV